MKRLRKIIKEIFKNKLKKLYPKNRLNCRGRGIINLIDVGSVGGLPDPWNRNASTVKFLLNFEPNDEPKHGKNFLSYNTAVWEADEILPFYIYKGINHTGSSLFKQNYEFVKNNYEWLKTRGPKALAETWFDRSQLVRETKVSCRTIDGILKDEFPLTNCHFMKIDAQGAEYNILKGAHDLLVGSCIGLHLELFTMPLYEGIVLLDEVKDYLEKFDYTLIKKFPAHGTFDSQHDCLFLKENRNSGIQKVIRKVYGLA